MRWNTRQPLRWGFLVVAAGLSAATACSHGAHHEAASSAAKAASSAAQAAAPPGVVGISPSGVTTKVDVPANSSESEYYQACHAAKTWMSAQPQTGKSLLEPYLAMVQASPQGSAGSWNSRWADLTPARQAAVITAAQAAANNECD